MRTLLALLIAVAHALSVSPATAQTTGSGTATAITPTETTDIPTLMAQASVSFPACGMWHPSGICFFLRCSIFECHIETSSRYSMMLPDLVISSYHDLDNHPYPMVGGLIQQLNLRTMSLLYRTMIGDSAGTRSNTKRRTEKDAKFRDADAVGHPGGFYTASYVCERAASSGMSYYSSFADAPAWRDFLPVDLLRLESWIPGMREIGNWPLNTWGNVLPRTGWHTHPHDVKVAATLSQRIADIVTHAGEPRTYTYLSSGAVVQRNGQTVMDPPPALENNLLGGQWQMSAPFVGKPPEVCHVFGMDDSMSPVGYGDFQTSKVESYAYTLWRPYACCDTEGAYLYSIVWGMW